MDIDKLTVKVQQSLNNAQLAAVKHNHQQVDAIHLFSALISEDDGLIPNIFEKMGVNIDSLRRETENVLDKMPKVLGEGAQNSSVYATRRFEEILVKSEKIAKKFKDSYISVEHVMMAIMDIHSSDVDSILNRFNINKKDFLEVLSKVRGNQT